MEELPSEITPADVDSALTELRSTSMDLTELNTLNDQYHSGDSMAIYDIRTQLERITKIPKQKKVKPKGWPIDVSIGYYTNDLILNLDGEVPISINSINRIYSLQVGKTLNFPWINWLGGIGIYGGVGFESSKLSMDYTFKNLLSFNDETNDDIKINLDFPGDNKFHKLIGARMRILFVDAYVDYNMGNSNNAINAGVGITFR